MTRTTIRPEWTLTLVLCSALLLCGCTDKPERSRTDAAGKQPTTAGAQTASPGRQPGPALAAGLTDVLGKAIPASGVMAGDLKSVEVDVAGQVAAVSYPAGRVTVWDIVQREKTAEIPVAESPGSLRLSPDGKLLLASVRIRERLSVWEVSSGRRVASVEDAFFDVEFSRSGDRVVVGGWAGITVVSTRGGEPVRLTMAELEQVARPGDTGDVDVVNQVAFGDDDTTVVASSASYWLTWRPGAAPAVVPLDYAVHSALLTHDRRQLVITSNLGVFRWDIATRKQVAMAESPGLSGSDGVGGVAFDATGEHLVLTRQERSNVDPNYTHSRVVNHVEAYRFPDLVKVWSDSIVHYQGPYTPAHAWPGAASGDLMVIGVGHERLVLRTGEDGFTLLTGPTTAKCPPPLECREGYAYGREDGRSVLYRWMYGLWRPLVYGQTTQGALTEPDLEAEGLYAPHFAKLFPEAPIVLAQPR